MSDGAAADEFARMTLSKEAHAHHPEDHKYSHEANDSDDQEDNYLDDGEEPTYSSSINLRSTKKAPTIQPPLPDHMPAHKTFGAANTGPKGVLADARSFEEARRRELQAKQGPAYSAPTDFVVPNVRTRLVEDERMKLSSDPDDDDEIMAMWRKNRLQELKQGATANRRKSPNRRKYGRLEAVDANGYLDAVEKVHNDVVVVVTIYDDQSSESQFVEDCMGTLARRHVCTRFIKLHYSEAEMDRKVVPAVLAYKAGELIANMPRVVDEVPTGRNLSSESLEAVLKSANVLNSEKFSSTSSRTSLYNWDDDN